MKITCISDTHGHLPEISPCDLLIHAGDICPASNHKITHQLGFLQGVFSNWLNQVPANNIVCVPGNHDIIFQEANHLIPKLKCQFLIDQLTEVNGIKMWGSPWQNWFRDWAFNAPKETSERFLAERYNLIPEDIDIIISHGPPYGIGDKASDGFICGSKSLLKRISEIKPKLVVTGHIHEGYGIYKLEDTTIINCSYLDAKYNPVNKPITFEF